MTSIFGAKMWVTFLLCYLYKQISKILTSLGFYKNMIFSIKYENNLFLKSQILGHLGGLLFAIWYWSVLSNYLAQTIYH